MSNLINHSLSPDLYKDGKKKREGLEEKLVEIFVRNLQKILEKVDVDYYSGGGLNHYRNRCVFPFSSQFLPFQCRTTF